MRILAGDTEPPGKADPLPALVPICRLLIHGDCVSLLLVSSRITIFPLPQGGPGQMDIADVLKHTSRNFSFPTLKP